MVGDNGADVGGGPISETELIFPKPITESEEVSVAKMMEGREKIGSREADKGRRVGTWSYIVARDS